MADLTYKGRWIWIYPYRAASGWNAWAAIRDSADGRMWMSERLALPANLLLRTKEAARAFAEKAVKREIDRRQ
jgi:hypothetical protein